MTDHVLTIKRLLTGLDKDQLRDVIGFATMVLKTGKGPAHVATDAAIAKVDLKLSSFEQQLLDVLCEHAKNAGLDHSHPGMLVKTAQFKAFRDKIPALKAYFDTSVEGNKIQKLSFMHLAARLLIDDLLKMDVSPSARTLLNHAHRIPAVINNAFPGYAQQGLLGLVFKQAQEVKHVRKKNVSR